MNLHWWQEIQRAADEADSANVGIDFWEHFPIPDQTWLIESPIEHKLYPWLLREARKCGYRVECNKPIGRFRYDFAILDGDQLLLLIECDGREFHSSVWAKARDQRKDNSAPVAVIRWTGGEIWRDPQACAAETFEAMR